MYHNCCLSACLEYNCDLIWTNYNSSFSYMKSAVAHNTKYWFWISLNTVDGFNNINMPYSAGSWDVCLVNPGRDHRFLTHKCKKQRSPNVSCLHVAANWSPETVICKVFRRFLALESFWFLFAVQVLLAGHTGSSETYNHCKTKIHPPWQNKNSLILSRS